MSGFRKLGYSIIAVFSAFMAIGTFLTGRKKEEDIENEI